MRFLAMTRFLVTFFDSATGAYRSQEFRAENKAQARRRATWSIAARFPATETVHDVRRA